MKDYIYGLYHYQDSKMVCFYIGRTNTPPDRLHHHKVQENAVYVRNATHGIKGDVKAGSYSKDAMRAEYVYMRENCKGNWRMKVLFELEEGKDAGVNEDAIMVHMIRRGHPLQNMKEGDKYPRWMTIAKSSHSRKGKAGVEQFDREVAGAKAKAEAHRLEVLRQQEEDERRLREYKEIERKEKEQIKKVLLTILQEGESWEYKKVRYLRSLLRWFTAVLKVPRLNLEEKTEIRYAIREIYHWIKAKRAYAQKMDKDFKQWKYDESKNALKNLREAFKS